MLFPTSLCGVLVFCLDPAAFLRLPPPSASPPLTLITALPLITAILTTAILITALLITTPFSRHLSYLTHHTTAPQLITAPLLTPPSSQHYSHNTHSTSSHTFLITALLITAGFRAAGPWPPLGPRLTFVWQAQYTEPPAGAAARWPPLWAAANFRVAGALHRASWRSCGARGRRLDRGWLSCGKRACPRWKTEIYSSGCSRHATTSLLPQSSKRGVKILHLRPEA